jgi:ABC-type branched-subunit amino acid transport system ATPase component
MHRRLDIGVSLVARPPVLFLDQPTTGLDPRTRNDLWVFDFVVPAIFVEAVLIGRTRRTTASAAEGRRGRACPYERGGGTGTGP